MIYVQQVRNRKETLVPKSTDDMIEVLSVVGDISNMVTIDPDHFVEVSTSSQSSEDSSSGVRPRKRAKLDHLSNEEKAQHRKMMNRISAQSARDRQKAMMQLQEIQIKNLCNSAEELKRENTSLKEKCENLTEENGRLNTLLKECQERIQKLESLNETKLEIKKEPEEISVFFDEDKMGRINFSSSLEPAVPRTVPLPKGPELLLKNFSVILLLLTYFQWILTHQNSSKLSKNSLSRSLVQKISSHMGLKKQSLQTQVLLQLLRRVTLSKSAKIQDPG